MPAGHDIIGACEVAVCVGAGGYCNASPDAGTTCPSGQACTKIDYGNFTFESDALHTGYCQ